MLLAIFIVASCVLVISSVLLIVWCVIQGRKLESIEEVTQPPEFTIPELSEAAQHGPFVHRYASGDQVAEAFADLRRIAAVVNFRGAKNLADLLLRRAEADG